MRTLVVLAFVGVAWVGWLTVTKEATGQLPGPVHEACRSIVERFDRFIER